ncbi:FmdB family transcriptional regulator, partial [Opitutaceae bacterium]|nr:FmdB family transcriptional regulator [Opitutaceae bacterium]
MPIYEFFCPDNNTVYQFYAKSVAQGETIPRCPDNPKFRLQKMVSGFAITKGGTADEPSPNPTAEAGAQDDPKMEAAMAAMESEFAQVDENDPKAMGRMMRRM